MGVFVNPSAVLRVWSIDGPIRYAGWPTYRMGDLQPVIDAVPVYGTKETRSCIAQCATNKNHYRLYYRADTLPQEWRSPSNPFLRGLFFWSVIIMELLLSLLVGCGISLILFYRK